MGCFYVVKRFICRLGDHEVLSLDHGSSGGAVCFVPDPLLRLVSDFPVSG